MHTRPAETSSPAADPINAFENVLDRLVMGMSIAQAVKTARGEALQA